LTADFFHNILDGIALGAIFSTGDAASCISALIAIIAHEIPQEIGDVGILLHSKFSNM
jgi:zinc transporter ZupT